MPRRDPTLTSWTAVAVCERLCAARCPIDLAKA